MTTDEAIPELDHFGPDEAWRLGAGMVSRCRSADLSVVVVIQLGQQRVFHAALPGTSADNDGWAERKARVVAHFGLSSAAVFDRYVKDNPEFFRLFALAPERYAPFPGAVPIKVRGTVVGTLAVSGLAGEEDHQLAVDALRGEAAIQVEGRSPAGPEPRSDQSERR